MLLPNSCLALSRRTQDIWQYINLFLSLFTRCSSYGNSIHNYLQAIFSYNFLVSTPFLYCTVLFYLNSYASPPLRKNFLFSQKTKLKKAIAIQAFDPTEAADASRLPNRCRCLRDSPVSYPRASAAARAHHRSGGREADPRHRPGCRRCPSPGAVDAHQTLTLLLPLTIQNAEDHACCFSIG